MKPSFALNLSHEGIVLLHRSPRGSWTEVGDIALDDPALGENLSFLRSTAVGLEGKGFATKLIIPNSQILYVEIDAPGPSEAERQAQIMAALEGRTPYETADLSVDWHGTGTVVEVAVVARETLDEAEDFAVEHRFNPVSFVGPPREGSDGWEPFFGRTDFSLALLGADADVRETPRQEIAAVSKDSLFSETPEHDASDEEEDGRDLSADIEAEASPSDENMFATKGSGSAPTNIFTDEPTAPQESDTVEEPSEPDAPVSAPALTPDPETQPDPPEPVKPVAPARPVTFSSRRKPSDSSDETEEDHLVDRISPRIAILPDTSLSDSRLAPELGSPAAEEPTGASPAQIVADDRLRASILGDDQEENAAQSITARLFGPLKGIPRITAVALGGLTGKIGSGAVKALARVRKRSTDTSGDQVEDGAAPAAPGFTSPAESVEDVAPAAPGLSEIASTGEETGERKPLPRRLAMGVAAVLAFLGLIGLVYMMLPGDVSVSDRESDQPELETVSLTRSPEHGVRVDNRPQPRPSDFATIVASVSGEPTGNPDLPLVRPERRSVFEGGVDPDEGKPDTVRPLTDLTEEELADIRAAGLPAPTQEEMAEGAEGNQPGQMTAAESAAAYEATGALQRVRAPPSPLADQDRDDIFVASIDRALEANDAIILPDFSNGPGDDQPRARLSPLDPGITFDLDAAGFVKPTKDGALNPDGILVFSGKPAATPPKKPKTEELVPPNPLLALMPKPRPADLKTGEDAIFVQGRLTLSQLRAKRGKSRPISAQAELAGDDATPTELAVLTSFQPAHRPSDFAATVEKTRVQLAAATPATDTIIDDGPVLPTRASVAKQATIKNAINLGRINLVGVYGTDAKRQALLRLPSGRFVKVKIGDRVDGGRVAAIGVNSLSYVKSGRNRVLKIPK